MQILCINLGWGIYTPLQFLQYHNHNHTRVGCLDGDIGIIDFSLFQKSLKLT